MGDNIILCMGNKQDVWDRGQHCEAEKSQLSSHSFDGIVFPKKICSHFDTVGTISTTFGLISVQLQVKPFWPPQSLGYQIRHYLPVKGIGSNTIFTKSSHKKSNSEWLWSTMEVIPYWPSQHQEISKLALHRTQEYQAGSPVSFACRFVSVLIRFTVPGRYGSCRFGFYGSVRFAGTLGGSWSTRA